MVRMMRLWNTLFMSYRLAPFDNKSHFKSKFYRREDNLDYSENYIQFSVGK